MRGKSKIVGKRRINGEQKIQHLLALITDEKQFLQDHRKLEKQFGSTLDEMKGYSELVVFLRFI